ncbi:hypothetical protein CN984_06110 [Bacillus cereus]|uniref:Uncharacterized protein n=1 Tax=Bacillus cereus TaxID=1396 RepID=A0A2B9QBH2_BACCE|nr:hypothetical protein [Bacillus cereus]PGO32326.1 hypothetical protein CN984_06110 [Bacillus cereus]
MLEKPMFIHNGYCKADPQEQEGIMTTSIDAEKLQSAISRVVMILQEYLEGTEPEGVNRSINEALEMLQKYFGQ